MGLIRLIGDQYALLSTDQKPDCLDGGTCIELDSGKRFYRQNGTWMLDYSSLIVSGFSTIFREDYQIPSGGIASGVAFAVPNGRIYVTGTNRLQVACNGIIQQRNSGWMDRDYQEASNTGIYFSYALPSGSIVDFTIFSKDSSITT